MSSLFRGHLQNVVLGCKISTARRCLRWAVRRWVLSRKSNIPHPSADSGVSTTSPVREESVVKHYYWLLLNENLM